MTCFGSISRSSFSISVFSDLTGRRCCRKLPELVQPYAIHHADPCPPAFAAKVGRFAIHGDALAEPFRAIAQSLMQAAIEGDLVGRFVNDRGNGARRVGAGEELRIAPMAPFDLAAGRRRRDRSDRT